MVGCRLNQAEIEQMALEFRQNGHEIVSSADQADTVVVNTCSVTNQAAADSRQKIRHAIRDGAKDVIATGCWSTVEPKNAAKLADNLILVDNASKDSLVRNYLNSYSNVPHSSIAEYDKEPIAREPLPGLRQRTRAFIKAQDGCDNLCTFCVTRVARGKGVSRPVAEVIADVNMAIEGGAKEIVLTGVHLGSWGQEWDDPAHLTDLIEQILSLTNIPRIRLSSLEPWDLDERFLSLWRDPRMMPHLHLPLQSGSDGTLKRMLRKVTTSSYRDLIDKARAIIPNVAITTDIIAGFPGETEIEFEQTLEFVREIDFAGAHVFTYSEREGTAATRIKPSVPHNIRKSRNHAIQEIVAQSAKAYRKAALNKTVNVLWESANERDQHGWKMIGLSDNYLKVFAYSAEPIWNQISQVKITEINENGVIGEIVSTAP